MAFAASSNAEMPANHRARYPRPLVFRVGPDTGQYGGVWPNEWPNGGVHTRDMEAADRARDGRVVRMRDRDARLVDIDDGATEHRYDAEPAVRALGLRR